MFLHTPAAHPYLAHPASFAIFLHRAILALPQAYFACIYLPALVLLLAGLPLYRVEIDSESYWLVPAGGQHITRCNPIHGVVFAASDPQGG